MHADFDRFWQTFLKALDFVIWRNSFSGSLKDLRRFFTDAIWQKHWGYEFFGGKPGHRRKTLQFDETWNLETLPWNNQRGRPFFWRLQIFWHSNFKVTCCRCYVFDSRLSNGGTFSERIIFFLWNWSCWKSMKWPSLSWKTILNLGPDSFLSNPNVSRSDTYLNSQLNSLLKWIKIWESAVKFWTLLHDRGFTPDFYYSQLW